MADKLKFFITDVFGTEKYSGNQLAIFTNCEGLTKEEMQNIAREINFSETTFIMSDKPVNGGYDVRIFTPKSEIDFAGHPTLGTAYIINKQFLNSNAERFILNLRAGQIPVEFRDDLLWMRQNKPVFGKKYDAEFIAKVLSIDSAGINTDYPIEEVSTGLPFTIVPIKERSVLDSIKVDSKYYNEFIQIAMAKGIVCFAPEGYESEQNISSRVFVEYLGIPEDPATGSGQGCLAGYLIKNNYFNSDSINIKIGQGYKINRPSVLLVKAHANKENIIIEVGGKVFPMANGFWE